MSSTFADLMPTTLPTDKQTFTLRRAELSDLPELVALLADDMLGQNREIGSDLQAYADAFTAISADPNHLLLTARSGAGELVATMQLTRLFTLARGGTARVQLEGIRVASAARGTGVGASLFNWVAEYARTHGAALLQLTTDKRRGDAHRFYRKLGFEATHEGMKLEL